MQDAGLICGEGPKVRPQVALRGDEPRLATGSRTPDGLGSACSTARINDSQGAEAAGELMAGRRIGRQCAATGLHRLYGICERKGWSAEGQVYNALVASWGDAMEAASRVEKKPRGQQLTI